MQCRTILLHPSMTSELYLWFDRISSWGDSTAEIQSPKIGDWGPFLLRTNWRCAQKSTVFKTSLTKPLNFIAEIILLLFNFFVISWFYYTETIKFSSMFRFRKLKMIFCFQWWCLVSFQGLFEKLGVLSELLLRSGFHSSRSAALVKTLNQINRPIDRWWISQIWRPSIRLASEVST